MSAKLTTEKLDELERVTDGFTCGEPWEQGTKEWDAQAEWSDGTVLVLAGDPQHVVFDCGQHDCGTELAAALVAMNNAFPALLQMVRTAIAARAELERLEHACRAAIGACANYLEEDMTLRGSNEIEDIVRHTIDAMVAERLESVRDARADAERLRIELARLSVCHVCGDCLEPEDGRCECHASMDVGDLDGDEPCGCAYCESKAGAAALKEDDNV